MYYILFDYNAKMIILYFQILITNKHISSHFQIKQQTMKSFRTLPDSFHHLELTIKKFDIIQKALKSIQTMPQLSKAGVLFNSILQQLSIMKQSIQSHIEAQNQMRIQSIDNKEEQLEEHNFIVEFYDKRIKNQEKKIDDLEYLNQKLVEEGENNARELMALENQLTGLKSEIEMFQNLEKNREFQSIEMLMKEVNSLIEELKHRDFTIQQLNEELRINRQQLSRGARDDHLMMSERLLEVNKVIDNTQAEYMKLVSELEIDNEKIRKQNIELISKMVMHEAKSQQCDQVVGMKNKQIQELINTIKKNSLDLDTYQKEQQKNASLKQGLIRQKQDEYEQIQSQLQKTEQALSNIHSKLQSKNQEVNLLEKQNCKLHQFLASKQNEIVDKQRIINTITLKYQHEKKSKQVLEEQLQDMGHQMKQLADRLDLASKFKSELERQRQQKSTLFREVNEKLTGYDTAFSEVRNVQLQKQDQFRKYIGVVKRQYEQVIAQLISNIKQLENTSYELQNTINVLNNKIMIQSEQLNMEKKKNIQFKVMMEEQNMIYSKNQESASNIIILEQQNTRLKKQCGQIQVKEDQIFRLKQNTKQLEEQIRELKDKQVKAEQKIIKLNSEYEKKLKQTQTKLIKFNQMVAQKQLEVAELSTKNKSLTQDLFSCKRSSALDKTRLETRLNELEKVLKDRKSFQAKVNNLIF